MTRIPHDGLFVKTYNQAPPTSVLVEDQLKNRYFTNAHLVFTPTEQERLWGINFIDPRSCYWAHFKERLPKVIQTLQDDFLSNRAVITIDFPAAPPCFQSFHFTEHDGHLELTCFARSLDIVHGLPTDAAIFWRAALVPVAQALNLYPSKLTIVSSGAHIYKD